MCIYSMCIYIYAHIPGLPCLHNGLLSGLVARYLGYLAFQVVDTYCFTKAALPLHPLKEPRVLPKSL